MANPVETGVRERQPISLFEAVLPLLTLAGLLITCAVFLEVNGQLLVMVLLASAAVAEFDIMP